ncbi:MAG: hypothetical protein GEV10_28980 [Streptosporangiales bacterium]|nr:hypothetical protein [Streptosporangiales bacterium]
MSCAASVTLGAYILGAVGGEERRAIEEHLETCQTCKKDLLNLAPLPGLLSRVSVEDVTEPRPVPAVPRPRPRRRLRTWARRLALGFASLVMFAAGGLAGGLVTAGPGPTEPRPAHIVWTGADQAGRLQGSAALTPHAWGTEIGLRLRQARLRAECTMVVNARGGSRDVAGSWVITSYPAGEITVATSTRLRDIASLEIYTKAGQRLLRLTGDTRSPSITATHS